MHNTIDPHSLNPFNDLDPGGGLGQKGVRGCSAASGQGTFFHLHESLVGSQKHQNRKISPSKGTFFGKFGKKVGNFEKIFEISVPFRVTFFKKMSPT